MMKRSVISPGNPPRKALSQIDGLHGSQRERTSESGFALIEVVVSLFLMVLVTGMVYAGYLFVSKAWVGWKRHMALESDLHLMMQRVAEDLTYAEQFSMLTDSTWTLTRSGRRHVEYAIVDSVLTRSGVRMHHTDVLVARFALTPSRMPTAYARTHWEVDPREAKTLVQVQVNLQVQGWSLVLEAATNVALRPHRPWLPVTGPETINTWGGNE